MDIDIDDLSSDIVFSRENQIFYDQINTLIKEHLTFSTSNILQQSFSERCFHILNHDQNDLDKFINNHDTLYWFLFFDYIVRYDSIMKEFKILLKDADEEKYIDFVSHLINSNFSKIFELYEIMNEVPIFTSFYDGKRNSFCKLLRKYIDNNFEKIHESFGGFLFLMQNIESPLIENIVNLYETLPLFSKYFNDYKKIKKEDYQNFRKFWYYLVKYQKIPMLYIYKFLPNFENDEILKIAINTSSHYNYYWSKIEENRSVFKRLKMDKIKYPIFDSF